MKGIVCDPIVDSDDESLTPWVFLRQDQIDDLCANKTDGVIRVARDIGISATLAGKLQKTHLTYQEGQRQMAKLRALRDEYEALKKRFTRELGNYGDLVFAHNSNVKMVQRALIEKELGNFRTCTAASLEVLSKSEFKDVDTDIMPERGLRKVKKLPSECVKIIAETSKSNNRSMMYGVDKAKEIPCGCRDCGLVSKMHDPVRAKNTIVEKYKLSPEQAEHVVIRKVGTVSTLHGSCTSVRASIVAVGLDGDVAWKDNYEYHTNRVNDASLKRPLALTRASSLKTPLPKKRICPETHTLINKLTPSGNPAVWNTGMAHVFQKVFGDYGLVEQCKKFSVFTNQNKSEVILVPTDLDAAELTNHGYINTGVKMANVDCLGGGIEMARALFGHLGYTDQVHEDILFTPGFSHMTDELALEFEGKKYIVREAGCVVDVPPFIYYCDTMRTARHIKAELNKLLAQRNFFDARLFASGHGMRIVDVAVPSAGPSQAAGIPKPPTKRARFTPLF